MPAPYSDNLYSADAYAGHGPPDDDEDDDAAAALSPTDGYFHASDAVPAASVTQTRSPPSQPSLHHHSTSFSSINVPVVPNVLVEDPTLRQQSAAAKAREAHEESLLNSPTATPPSTTNPSPSAPASPPAAAAAAAVPRPARPSPAGPSSSHPRPYPQPLAHPADAPPAYSPSGPPAAQPAYLTFAPTPAATATASAMGVPEEQQLLLPRQPESMGGGLPGGPSNPTFWQRTRAACAGPKSRGKLSTLLGLLVILSILFIILNGVDLHYTRTPDIIEKEPVRAPEMDNGDLEWAAAPQCLGGPLRSSKTSASIHFGVDRSLSVIQTVEKETHEPNNGRSPQVSGEVRLRVAPGASTGKIVVETMANDENLAVNCVFDSEVQEFKMIVPRHVPWPGESKMPCIQIRATVWVPSEAVLNVLSVSTVHLDIQLGTGLVVGVAEAVALTSVVGSISAPSKDGDSRKVPYNLSSRRISLETISGDVSGWFPLFDLLSISTISGDVTVDVEPKPAAKKSPEAAVLNVSSISGDVRVKEPVPERGDEEAVPARDYVTVLETKSGHITAVVAFSSTCSIQTISGEMTLTLWPVLDAAAAPPILRTESKSGDLDLRLLEPWWTSRSTRERHEPAKPGFSGDDDPYLIIHPDHVSLTPAAFKETPALVGRSLQSTAAALDDDDAATSPALSRLSSKHETISGHAKIVYPSSWEGSLSAQTMSGSQNVRGEGLQLTRSGRHFPKLVKGHKGDGSSDMRLTSMSGDQDVLIGKEA